MDYSPAVSRFGPTTEINDISVRPLLSNGVSAGGYILSQQGCKKHLNWSTVYSDRLDNFVFMPRPGWHGVQVFPAVATQLWMTAEAKQQEAYVPKKIEAVGLWDELRRELSNAERIKISSGLDGNDNIYSAAKVIDRLLKTRCAQVLDGSMSARAAWRAMKRDASRL